MINENSPVTVANYWSEEAKADKLYVAIRANDTAEIERLRAEGITLSDHIKAMLTFGGGGYENYKKYGMDWYNFNFNLSKYSPEEFIAVIQNLYKELHEPIYYTENVGSSVPEFYSADVFKCVLNCFDSKKIPKKQTLLEIIDKNSVELLEIAAEHNWFRYAKKCDEYIEYANQKGRTECAAWLADYKSRTFDLAKEREKAEKRAERELNASPDSVTALKALWNYRKNDDGTLTIRKYKGTQTELVFPEKIGKNIVTALEVDTTAWGTPKRDFVSFDIRNSITKITLPKTLVKIGDAVFYEFLGLREINIPNGVTSIGKRAFDYCESLVRIALPESVREIGSNAFSLCKKLEEINISSGIIELPHSLFTNCVNLKAIEIPESVKIIGENAFENCESLEFIKIPNGVKEINDHLFSGCDKLTRVELPNTIEKINRSAFWRCLSLKEIVIPEGVREICETVFTECPALEKVVLPSSLQKIKNYTQSGVEPRTIFYNSPNVTAVVTPKSYAEKYCKRNKIPYVYKEN